MKIIGERNDMLKGIQTVQNAIGDKTILPILSNVLIETISNTGIQISATDLKITISCFIPLEVVGKGTITIPAKRFSDIVRELPEKKIEMDANEENKVKISCEKIKFSIMGLPKEDFPKLPLLKKGEKTFSIKVSVLKDMIRKTIFSVAQDDTRYILNGANMHCQDNTITMACTNGHRLSWIKQDIEEKFPNEFSIIIPSKALVELNKILTEEEGSVTITISENKAEFKVDNISMICNLIEGQFPNVDQIIQKKQEKLTTIATEDLLKATKRVSIVAMDKSSSVKLNVTPNKLIISANTPEIGEADEQVDISYSGEETSIIINYKYLLDIIKNIQSPITEMQFTDPSTAVVFKPEKIKNYLGLIMPIRPS